MEPLKIYYNPPFADAMQLRGIDRWVWYGGRNSGKSFSFALKSIIGALQYQREGAFGTVIAARATQKSLEGSMLKEMRNVLALYPQLAPLFRLTKTGFATKAGRVSFEFCGTNINPESIKGITNAFMAGADEANEITQEGLDYLEPTVRAQNAMGIHYLFNPSTTETPMARMLMQMLDGAGGRTAEANLYRSFVDTERRVGFLFTTYRENVFLSDFSRRVINQKQREMDADDFDCIYNGRFRAVKAGAYYARCIEKAEIEGRLPADIPYQLDLPTFICWDMGKNDMMAAVVCQVWQDMADKRLKVSVLDYLTGIGYPVQYYGRLLQERGYGAATQYLPHDAAQSRGYTDSADDTAMRELVRMGFKAQLVPNQGAGAAWDRIVKTRTVFSRIFIAQNDNTKQLMASLRNYAPKMVNGLPTNTPDHEFSDACDAFGLIPFVLEDCESIERLGNRSGIGKYQRHDSARWSDGL